MKKAWVVTVNMGYGHQRAAAPLLSIAEGGTIITANDYEGIPEADRKRWKSMEAGYYAISRIKEHGGFLGERLFRIFDRFQIIHDLDYARDERRPTLQLRQIYRYVCKGFGRHLIEKLSENPIPLIATFFTVAHMADVWKYSGDVYVITTDSDISRAWVSFHPLKNNFRYCASTERVVAHLKKYGVPAERILLTGFPLPQALTKNIDVDYQNRLTRLQSGASITAMFAVGGAGAQAGIGAELLKDTVGMLRSGELRLTVVTGKNETLAKDFEELRASVGLSSREIQIMRAHKGLDFLGEFNDALRNTDLLWTKPSELSFYASLGLPIVMTPPVGAQEIRNREWLLSIGSGIDYPTHHDFKEWIVEERKKRTFEKMACAGFERMERNGTEHILKLLS